MSFPRFIQMSGDYFSCVSGENLTKIAADSGYVPDPSSIDDQSAGASGSDAIDFSNMLDQINSGALAKQYGSAPNPEPSNLGPSNNVNVDDIVSNLMKEYSRSPTAMQNAAKENIIRLNPIHVTGRVPQRTTRSNEINLSPISIKGRVPKSAPYSTANLMRGLPDPTRNTAPPEIRLDPIHVTGRVPASAKADLSRPIPAPTPIYPNANKKSTNLAFGNYSPSTMFK